MLYSHVLLIGSNPVRISFCGGLGSETVLKQIIFIPFLGIQLVFMNFSFMYEWEWQLYFDMFAVFLAHDFVIKGQVEVLSFSLEAAWLTLMEAICFASILQKGSNEVTLNL